ncbi:hypothetical protein M2401_005524 [Pseudomonas sp. JUb42]|uniref:hypothetical protein n=1 Tax=Pseudomonas sp. JUb42 TaxID=2940611 RepID=UPI002166EADC|nr:hypothetical protein [Pseudomonas sp. JUb42]MCS3471760.1 hypothetical protein [Pseudomonas sp. JUb42]
MNDKLSPYRDAIFYRHRQRYTLEMIQLWLFESHKLSVCKSAIARSIYKNVKSTLIFERVAVDYEYHYYRTKISARRQKRNYKAHLSFYLGIIKHRQICGYSAIQVYDSLIEEGVKTSLSSVRRAMKADHEKK